MSFPVIGRYNIIVTIQNINTLIAGASQYVSSVIVSLLSGQENERTETFASALFSFEGSHFYPCKDSAVPFRRPSLLKLAPPASKHLTGSFHWHVLQRALGLSWGRPGSSPGLSILFPCDFGNHIAWLSLSFLTCQMEFMPPISWY